MPHWVVGMVRFGLRFRPSFGPCAQSLAGSASPNRAAGRGLVSSDLASLIAGFWTLLKPRSRYFGARFSKKRLAWIRTHARLRRSGYGLQAVVVTTPPTPRLRFKGCGSR